MIPVPFGSLLWFAPFGSLSDAEQEAAALSDGLARMQYGNAVERLLADAIEENDLLDGLFKHVSGPNNPDFVGKGIFEGMIFDVTTPGQVAAHQSRPGYGANLIIVTYDRPPGFP